MPRRSRMERSSRWPKNRFVRLDGLVHEVWSWGSSGTPRMKATTVCTAYFIPTVAIITSEVPTCLACAGKP